MLDTEREAATELAHERSPDARPEDGVGSHGATRHAALNQPLLDRQDGDQEDRFNFMPPSGRRTAIEDGQRMEALREGAWVDGGSSGPTQVWTTALPPRGSSGAVAAPDARIAQAGARTSEEPAKIAAALQAWHEAAATQSPPPERLTHANDSASERERQGCVQLMHCMRNDLYFARGTCRCFYVLRHAAVTSCCFRLFTIEGYGYLGLPSMADIALPRGL